MGNKAFACRIVRYPRSATKKWERFARRSSIMPQNYLIFLTISLVLFAIRNYGVS